MSETKLTVEACEEYAAEFDQDGGEIDPCECHVRDREIASALRLAARALRLREWLVQEAAKCAADEQNATTTVEAWRAEGQKRQALAALAILDGKP